MIDQTKMAIFGVGALVLYMVSKRMGNPAAANASTANPVTVSGAGGTMGDTSTTKPTEQKA